MTSTEEAILRTVIYADIFDFPLTRQELHHFLIADTPVPRAQVEQTLNTSLVLPDSLEIGVDYVVCAGRSPLIPLRQQREAASQRLWTDALRYGRWLARLPFVRMVALTGALAMRNASDSDDDLDYVLVTAPGRVWLARAFAIVLVKLAARRGVIVCPNYVLAETALTQDRRDLFVAHEVAQMLPLYGRSLYDAMRAQNVWVDDHLPNATAPLYDEGEGSPDGVWGLLKRSLEYILGGHAGSTLEGWEYRRKLRRFAPDLQMPHSAAQLDAQHVKGHFNDHGHPVMRKYHERLCQIALETAPLAGD